MSITFDGSKVNFAIEGMLARFLSDDHMPTTVCIGCKALKTSVDAKMMRQLIKDHLADANIAVSQVVAFCSDSGPPPNPTTMQEWNKLAGNLYFGQDLVDNTVLWLPCLMHAVQRWNCVAKVTSGGEEVHVWLQRNGEHVVSVVHRVDGEDAAELPRVVGENILVVV